MTFDHPRLPFNPKNRRIALSRINDTLDEVLKAWANRPLEVEGPLVSVYEGTGTMTDFLVLARAPHRYFHEFVRDLVLKLRRAGLDGLFDMRPYTHVIADEMFSEFTERRRLAGPPDASELDLSADEDESLEYKATFASNLRSFIATGRQEKDDRCVHAVIRAICGLLNSPDGGQLIIGVLEVRRELEKVKDVDQYLRRLRELTGYEFAATSEDDEATSKAPNAIVGIEIETGNGRVFSDSDRYLQRLTEALRAGIAPGPMPWLSINLVETNRRHVCVIRARPADVWFYARSDDGRHQEFYVREAAATRAYAGTESDLWKRANPRSGRVNAS